VNRSVTVKAGLPLPAGFENSPVVTSRLGNCLRVARRAVEASRDSESADARPPRRITVFTFGNVGNQWLAPGSVD